MKRVHLIVLLALAIGFGQIAETAGQVPDPASNIRIVPPAGTSLASRPRLKVVTYNVASGASWTCKPPGFNTGAACLNWRSVPIDFEGLGRHIMDQGPDVVLLQEVHDRYIDGRHPQINQPQYWRQRLGMNGQYLITSKAYNFWGTLLGTAGEMILSRHRIVQVDEDRQPFDRGIDFGIGMIGMGAVQSPRSKLSVVIDVNGTRVRVASVHLPGDRPDRLLEYLTWLDRFPEPAIVGGDFNRGWPDLVKEEDPFLRTAFARYNVAPNDDIREDRRCPGNIDYMLVRRGQVKIADTGGHGRVAGVCPTTLSDHPLAYATVEVESVPIFNPGFEYKFQQWSVWSPDSAYAAYVLPFGFDGLNAAAQSGASGFIWRDVPVRPGRDYDITARVRCDGGALGMLSVHDTAGGSYQETPYACSPHEWAEVRLRYRANQTRQVRIHLVRGPGVGWVFWDSVHVELVGD